MNRLLPLLALSLALFCAAALPGRAGAQDHLPNGVQHGFPSRSVPPATSAPNTAAPSMQFRSPTKEVVKTSAGEEFFIIASVDQSKSQVLVKRPTEVTELVVITPKTQLQDERGKPLRLSDFRAGDTVWAITSGTGPEIDAVRIRKGEMTVADLHRYYLDYPEIK